MQNQECTNHDIHRERDKAIYIYIYMKEYIDELWGKIPWGTRAWGWRVASFVEICSYVCMFSCAYWSHASNWTWNIQHSLWIQRTMHPARILKSCISVGLMNKNTLQCFPFDNQTKKHLHTEIWGLFAFEVWCFVSLLVVAWQRLRSFLAVSIFLNVL